MTQRLREHADWLDATFGEILNVLSSYEEVLVNHEARIARLEEVIAPPPAPRVPWLVGVNGSSEHTEQFGSVRVFKGIGKGGLTTLPYQAKHYLVSLKPPQPEESDEYIRATVQTWLDAGRPIEDLRIALWHEPEDNMSAAEWEQYQIPLEQRAAAYGFKPTAIFTAQIDPDFYAKIPLSFEEVWLDPYDWSGQPKDLFDETTYVGSRLVPQIRQLKNDGFMFGLAETATEAKAGQAAWIYEHAQWVYNEGGVGYHYFDRIHTNSKGETRDWRLTPDGLEALKAAAMLPQV